jgi:hypothetical protein
MLPNSKILAKCMRVGDSTFELNVPVQVPNRDGTSAFVVQSSLQKADIPVRKSVRLNERDCMDVEKLSQFVELPETHRKVLSGYRGAYSLGIGQDLARSREPVLILQIEKQPAESIPNEVRLNGETVPVVVRTGFVAPRAFSTSH